MSYDDNFLHAHKNIKQVCLLTRIIQFKNILIQKLPYTNSTNFVEMC